MFEVPVHAGRRGEQPAERRSRARQGQIAVRREGDDADDQDRREQKGDEQRMKDERRGPVAAHLNGSANRRSTSALAPSTMAMSATRSSMATAAPSGQLSVFRNSS